jgi:hypothetical protein
LLYRLGRHADGESMHFSHPPSYRVGDDRHRVVAGVPGSDFAVFAQLVACLEPPVVLLFVLHTPRGVGEPGRYQSPDLEPAQLHDFFARFGNYLARDGRHDVWAYSPATRAQVIWDRHDRVFAYGPIDDFVRALHALGFAAGEEPVIPSPHTHHYDAAFDADAAALLAWCDWYRTPLRPEDEQ